MSKSLVCLCSAFVAYAFVISSDIPLVIGVALAVELSLVAMMFYFLARNE